MRYVACAALLSALSCAAVADVMTVSASVSGLTDFYATAALPQFDPALGTLTGVSFEAHGAVSGYFIFTNDAGANKRARVDYVDWQVDVTAFGAPVGNVIHVDWVTPPTDDNPFGGPPGHWNMPLSGVITAGQTLGPIPYGANYDAAAGYVPADGQFASFIGAATMPVDVAIPVLFGYTVFGSGTHHESLHTEGSLTVSATYTYDPIPAPAGAGVLMLAGLGARRRRR